MMTLQKFRDLFEAREISPLVKAQEACWERFLEIGWPTKKTEAYRYIKLQNLEEKSFCQATAPFLFENLSLLPKEMIILPLAKAWRSFGAYLQARYLEMMKKENDPFAALNGALCVEGTFIYLPPATVCKVPLVIVRSGCAQNFSTPRLHLSLGKGAKFEVYIKDYENQHAQNSMIDVSLEEGAELKITTLISSGIDAFHIEGMRATLKRQSSLKTVLVTSGCKMFRHDAIVSMLGEGANADLKGITFVKGKNEAHFGLKVEHLAPNCQSLQKFKNVLSDYSKTSFEGKIFVDPIAQKTQAYQMNPNLLLSDRATAISRPNLEIFADDVKASHGSVVGQIDDNHLFYLKSRGLSEEAAKKLLITGFCKEILDEITLADFQNEAFQLVSL